MTMNAFAIDRFAAALRDRSLSPPAGLVGPVVCRFAVYRNNVAVGLIRALEARFPAVFDLVGEEFFRAMARDFALAHPPASPIMIEFGDRFPDFIASFLPAADLPYLADVARIEVARTRAYHAADAPRLEADAFASVPPDRLGDLRLVFHPAVTIVRSAHPALTIFSMGVRLIEPGPIEAWCAEDALVDRPIYDATVRRLTPDHALFLQSLQEGATLQQALYTADAANADFDLASSLVDLIRSRPAIHLTTNPEGVWP
jgi:hypothetical protein